MWLLRPPSLGLENPPGRLLCSNKPVLILFQFGLIRLYCVSRETLLLGHRKPITGLFMMYTLESLPTLWYSLPYAWSIQWGMSQGSWNTRILNLSGSCQLGRCLCNPSRLERQDLYKHVYMHSALSHTAIGFKEVGSLIMKAGEPGKIWYCILGLHQQVEFPFSFLQEPWSFLSGTSAE